jgi:hypothetical protein
MAFGGLSGQALMVSLSLLVYIIYTILHAHASLRLGTIILRVIKRADKEYA